VVRDSLLVANRPYDQIVREKLLAATGHGDRQSAGRLGTKTSESQPKEQIEDVAQLFLGGELAAVCSVPPSSVRNAGAKTITTAPPAFFSQVGLQNQRRTRGAGFNFINVWRGGRQGNIKTARNDQPCGTGATMSGVIRRRRPAARFWRWMAAEENPFLPKALVNRYWKHFFHSPRLIEPEDRHPRTRIHRQIRIALAALEKHLSRAVYDLKELRAGHRPFPCVSTQRDSQRSTI